MLQFVTLLNVFEIHFVTTESFHSVGKSFILGRRSRHQEQKSGGRTLFELRRDFMTLLCKKWEKCKENKLAMKVCTQLELDIYK